MRKLEIAFLLLMLVSHGLLADTTIIGKIVTYSEFEGNAKTLKYYLGIDDEYSTSLVNGKFLITIDDSKLPTTLEIAGFDDSRIIEGGSVYIGKTPQGIIDLGEVFAFDKIYLERIKERPVLNTIVINWTTNITIRPVLFLEITHPGTKPGQWVTVFASSLGQQSSGQVLLSSLDGAIEAISGAMNHSLYIRIAGYLIQGDKRKLVSASDAWPVKF